MRTNSHAGGSSSQAGQGWIWATAVGILLIMAFSYLSTLSGVSHSALDQGDNEIASVSKPHKSKPVSRWHPRHHSRSTAISE